MAWTNDDGLYVKFGTELSHLAKGGQYRDASERIVVEIEFDFNDLAAFGTTVILEDNVLIPDGAHIEEVELYVLTAFDSSGDNGTLTLGLYDQDRTTAIDADGLDATIAQSAIDAEGDTIACDGDLVNTTITNTGLVSALVGTSTFTAGKARLRIRYFIA